MKRWMIFGGLTLLVAVFASLATMPSRFVLDQVRARDAAITYLNASGTVWNGSASRMYYGIQPIWNADLQNALGIAVCRTFG